MKKWHFAFFGFLASFACTLMADVSVQGDSHELTFANSDYEAHFARKDEAGSVWILKFLKYKQWDLIAAGGSSMRWQGDEHLSGGGYIGSSGFGGEETTRAVIIVDGKEHPADQPLTISGKEVELVVEGILGPYKYISRISLSDLGLRQEAAFEIVKDASNVDILYPFVHALHESFTNWIAGTEEGLSSSGEFKDDNSFTNLGRRKWFAGFSGGEGYGVLVSFAENYEGGEVTHRFWNRPGNKPLLYFWPPVPRADAVQFVCRVAGFEADEGSWTEAAENIEMQLTGKP